MPTFDVAQLARDSDGWRVPPAARDSGTRLHIAPTAPNAATEPSGPAECDSSVHLRATDMYWSRIGRPDAVPRLTVPGEWIHPDERADCAGFILCRVDGRRSVAEIVDDSTLPLLTALSLLCSLLDAGLLVVDDPR